MREESYRWAWQTLVEELDGRLARYEGKEVGLRPEARGWLECLRYMRRKAKALARRMGRMAPVALSWQIDRQAMWLQLKQGGETTCPCCGRYMKVYNRRIHHEMARFLVWLVHRSYKQKGGWVHVRNFPHSRSGDYAKLMYWDLIEPKPHAESPTSRESGYWRPTEDGVRFARGLLAVPTYAQVFDNEVQGHAGPPVFIRHALGTRFDYDELVQKWPVGHVQAQKDTSGNI